MNINIENKNYTYSISTESKRNGTSCVACIKGFVKPLKNEINNKTVIEKIDKKIQNIVNKVMEKSKKLSDNYIVDFECTKDNLNPKKWSRFKTDIYLMAEDEENEVIDNIRNMCEKIGNEILKTIEKNGFCMSYSNV